jgi:hypothetical protein
LFWDVDISAVGSDYPEWEIGRILTFGTLAEVRECISRFGVAKTRQVLVSNRSIPPEIREFWLDYGFPATQEAMQVLHREVLPPHSIPLLQRLAQIDTLRPFMLCGGTAVALRLGHRYSEDFDLFTSESFDVEVLATEVRAMAARQVTDERRSRNTWHGIIDGVRVSCIRQVGILLSSEGDVDGVPLASLETLAALKLNAVAGRGERKDFIDVFSICRVLNWTVADLVRVSARLMPSMNDAHLLRSLTYFDDAEKTPMPRMLWACDWREVRKFFERGVQAYLSERNG